MIPAEWNAPVSSVVHSTYSSKLSSQESLKSTDLESWKCVGLDRVRALTKTHIHAHTTPFQSRWQVNYHLSPWPYNYDSQTDKAHPPWSFFPFFSPTLPLCYPYVSPSSSHLFPTACVRIRVKLIYGSDSRFWFKWQAEWWIYHSLIDYTLLTTH